MNLWLYLMVIKMEINGNNLANIWEDSAPSITESLSSFLYTQHALPLSNLLCVQRFSSY